MLLEKNEKDRDYWKSCNCSMLPFLACKSPGEKGWYQLYAPLYNLAPSRVLKKY